MRLTVAIDYETENPANPDIRYLRLFLDGVALSSHAAYTTNDGSGLPNGFWFPIYHQPQASVSEMSFHDGTFYLDDLTVTTHVPRTLGGTPWPWLAQYGLSSSDAESDFDNDGFSAAQEYIAGTDPTDFERRFVIQSIDVTTGIVQIAVHSAEERLYTLERRSGLAPATAWLPVTEMTDVPGTGRVLCLYTQMEPADFFRVRVRKK